MNVRRARLRTLVATAAIAGLAAHGAGSADAPAPASGAPLMLDPAAIAALGETNDAWKLSPDDPKTKVEKNDEEWRRLLSPEQYYVLREAGT
jgi:hypothetical protein